MARDLRGMLVRGLRKPPRVIVRRLRQEIHVEAERFISPLRARQFSASALLRATGASSLDALWRELAARPYPAVTARVNRVECERVCPGDPERILAAAEDALEHQINLLGSGVISLGTAIDWYRDYRSGYSWPCCYVRGLEYNNLERPSDVKMPWEVSRLQWLIPAGQAYLLTGDERYATGVRDVLESWIRANPYAHSVNWACTMEVALRIFTWSWLFHVFHQSSAWADREFRARFLCALYLHGDFTQRHIEISDINGNHCTADAAGLVFAGLFFGRGRGPASWLRLGWRILCEELPRQVYPDGVDFEQSVAYHRLVMELFLLPALYRQVVGEDVPSSYRDSVTAMARFAAAYCRPSGSVPLWGDADDARALPFGGQAVNDHRYLVGIVGAAWDIEELRQGFAGSRSEAFWLLGGSQARKLPSTDRPARVPSSSSFPNGGFYIMRSDRDHIFIDCGPVGLAGRGGHGHNDCLSFEAVLLGDHLVSDCGAYVYTASYQERNLFRSTAYHNTPRIDGQEINRFIQPDDLWHLRNDALPDVRRWRTGTSVDVFVGSHTGYHRFDRPVTPLRTILLDHAQHALVVEDAFEGIGNHTLEIPLHLAEGVAVQSVVSGEVRLSSPNRQFLLAWGDAGAWQLSIEPGRVSPSYGVVVPITRLFWRREGDLAAPLVLCLIPADMAPPDPLQWAHELLRDQRKS